MLCGVHALAKSGPLSVMEVVVSDILNGKIISKMHHSVKSDESVGAKTNNLGSDQVRHKPACAVTEDGKRLEILNLESRGIVLPV